MFLLSKSTEIPLKNPGGLKETDKWVRTLTKLSKMTLVSISWRILNLKQLGKIMKTFRCRIEVVTITKLRAEMAPILQLDFKTSPWTTHRSTRSGKTKSKNRIRSEGFSLMKNTLINWQRPNWKQKTRLQMTLCHLLSLRSSNYLSMTLMELKKIQPRLNHEIILS